MSTVTVAVPFNTTSLGTTPDYRTTEVIDYVYPGPDGYTCSWDTTTCCGDTTGMLQRGDEVSIGVDLSASGLPAAGTSSRLVAVYATTTVTRMLGSVAWVDPAFSLENEDQSCQLSWGGEMVLPALAAAYGQPPMRFTNHQGDLGTFTGGNDPPMVGGDSGAGIPDTRSSGSVALAGAFFVDRADSVVLRIRAISMLECSCFDMQGTFLPSSTRRRPRRSATPSPGAALAPAPPPLPSPPPSPPPPPPPTTPRRYRRLRHPRPARAGAAAGRRRPACRFPRRPPVATPALAPPPRLRHRSPSLRRRGTAAPRAASAAYPSPPFRAAPPPRRRGRRRFAAAPRRPPRRLARRPRAAPPPRGAAAPRAAAARRPRARSPPPARAAPGPPPRRGFRRPPRRRPRRPPRRRGRRPRAAMCVAPRRPRPPPPRPRPP